MEKNEIKVNRTFDDSMNIYQYELEQNGNRLSIRYMGNLDLYFTYYKKNSSSIIIDKSNMSIYNLFNELYEDVKNCNVFDKDSLVDYEEEDFENLLEENKKLNKATKYIQEKLFINYRIKWISDDSNEDTDYNAFILKKKDGKIELSFVLNEHMNKSIRFSNSGSRHDPYNLVFMRMFNKLQKYDPECHQITIDEYNFRKPYK